MDPLSWLIFGLVVVLVLWLALSRDRFASTIRARFQGAKAQAANALDDANARMQVAEDDVDGRLSKANAALIEIKTMRHSVDAQAADAQAKVTKWTTAAENAASVQNQNLVVEALNRKAAAEANLAQILPQQKFLNDKEAEVQNAVVALNRRKALLKDQRIQIRTRAQTAKTTLSVNELLAGVDLNGQQKDVDRAFEIVAEVEAKSGAMGDIANQVTAKQAMDDQLEALSRPQQSSVDAQAEALMAKYAKPAQNSNSSDKANGA